MISYKINPSREEWPELLQRPAICADEIEPVVEAILREVRQNGDAALKKYTLQFDKATIENILVSERELSDSFNEISAELKEAISVAKQNIQKYHLPQRRTEEEIEIVKGVTCWRKQLPIEKVGLYVPGGSAPLFSSLLMLAIPALIAGCKEIVVCTPPQADGKIADTILFTASILGIQKIYKCGGVQAIAAMAYGTETIPAVNKIFGPGNQYVTVAKQLVSRHGVAIDMPAGPSEVAVYADKTAVPSFVAADLLSQAEHGEDSQVLLIATDESIVQEVIAEVEKQLTETIRIKQAKASIANSLFIVMQNTDKAFAMLNEYAPEHLIIASEDASSLAALVMNAGSVFLGNYTPEAAGDYATGTNHTLPTNGYAKTYSGVSVDSFMKWVSFQQITKNGLEQIGPVIEAMAEAEGLFAHSNAIKLRNGKSLEEEK